MTCVFPVMQKKSVKNFLWSDFVYRTEIDYDKELSARVRILLSKPPLLSSRRCTGSADKEVGINLPSEDSGEIKVIFHHITLKLDCLYLRIIQFHCLVS